MTFFEVVTAAINDIAEYGYDSQARVDMWVQRIVQAAEDSLTPPDILAAALQGALTGIYKRLVEKDGLISAKNGINRFTIDRLKPKLRSELDRRVMASANLIKLNREQMIAKTIQRFSGWATSIPPGGSDVIDRKEVKSNIRKSLAQLPFEERRVAIDQGHKLAATIHQIVAVDSGAIAAKWKSHWRQAGYDYRKDHKDRDNKIYTIRGNRALKDGLMKVGSDGYTDEITAPGEEVFCQCSYVWIYLLRDLPDNMLTEKGKARK